MKTLYKKLKSIDSQIAEAKETLTNIEGWAVSEAEKQLDREKYNHWLGELHESRLTVLFDLKSIVENEIHQYKADAHAA